MIEKIVVSVLLAFAVVALVSTLSRKNDCEKSGGQFVSGFYKWECIKR